jgi:heptaprenyl diphosphate synthase
MQLIQSMQLPGNRDNTAVPAVPAVPAEIAAKTALLLLAVGINSLEYMLPRIPVFPWLKPGLANIVTIIWILRWGAADALLFSVVRSWITSFYFGFSLVSLGLSLSGGLVSAAGMGALWLLFGRRGWLGLAGLGIAGAVLHNAGQLCGVYLFIAATPVLWYQVPFMLGASLVSGALTGFFAYALLPMLLTTASAPAVFNAMTPGKGTLRCVAGAGLLAASIGITVLHSSAVLGMCAVLATVLSWVMTRWKLGALLLPITRFWLLFAFVAVMYLFFSYGRTVAWLPFVTYEGIHETMRQWLRVWTWIQISDVLTRLEFNRAVLNAAIRHMPFGRATLIASLFALELFPAFVALPESLQRRTAGAAGLSGERTLERVLKLIRRAFDHPVRNVAAAIGRLYGEIVKLVEQNATRAREVR